MNIGWLVKHLCKSQGVSILQISKLLNMNYKTLHTKISRNRLLAQDFFKIMALIDYDGVENVYNSLHKLAIFEEQEKTAIYVPNEKINNHESPKFIHATRYLSIVNRNQSKDETEVVIFSGNGLVLNKDDQYEIRNVEECYINPNSLKEDCVFMKMHDNSYKIFKNFKI